MRTQECGIGYLSSSSFSPRYRGGCPSYYPKEIPSGVHFGKPYRVFAFATASSRVSGWSFCRMPPTGRHAFGILQDIGKGFYRFKADEFFWP